MILSDSAKKRYNAFWECDAYKRCCLSLWVTKDAGIPESKDTKDITREWEDSVHRISLFNQLLERTELFADGIYCFFVNFGPGCLSAMIGGTYKWSEETVWFENEQVITDWENPPGPILHKESPMYRLSEKLTEAALNAGKGKFLTSVTDIGGIYDIIAALRGTQTLLLDLYEYPEEIKAYAKELRRVWMEYFHEQAFRLISQQGGMVSWMPIWSDKPYYPLQCDFSAMISPDMFEEFILPDLRYQTENMPRSIYHLDGPGEIPHLKLLLSLPRLNAIQWSPGAGQANVGDECWFGLYEEIQAAGKGLVLFDVKLEQMENLLKHISPKGLFISAGAKDSMQAAEYIRIAGSV